MGIVGIHELGHMFASRFHGLKSSWPYFIPMPIGLGTIGAFITMKAPFRSRNNLFDVGLAGPIFGFVASVIFSIIGLMNSIVVPITEIPSSLAGTSGFMDFRIPLFQLLVKLLIPEPSVASMIFLHPFAYAGFIGLFITGLNLIPIGQSDGGHVTRSLFSETQHRYVTYISAGVLILLGFWFFAILLLYMYSQTGHSGAMDDLTEVSLSRKIVAVCSLILLVICLPIPSDIFSLLFPSL
jgi:membrane-associated protease RseP (regulator of RpoE activity)